MRKLERILAYAICAALFCAFAAFALLCPRADTLAIVCGSFSVLILAIICLRGSVPLIKFFTKPLPAPLYEKLGERSRRRLYPTFRLILLALAAQLVFILAIYAISNSVNGFSGTVFERYDEIFMSRNRFGLGLYANEAGRLLAPFPALPLLCDLAGGLTGKFTLCAFVINTACVCAAAVMLHRLMLFDLGRREAFETLVMLCLSPLMIFLLMPMSGVAPFLLFSLCTLYFMRRGKPVAAGLFCIPAVATNIFGLLLIVPLLMDSVKQLADGRGSGKRPTFGAVFGVVLSALLPIAAVLAVFAADRLELYEFSVPSRLFSDGFRTCFEELGRFAKGWNTSLHSANAMFSAIVATVGFGLVFGLAAKRIHAPYTVFTLLWYTLVPAALGGDMAIYALCLCPTLPIITAACFKKRGSRLALMGLLLAAQIVFAAVIFVRK